MIDDLQYEMLQLGNNPAIYFTIYQRSQKRGKQQRKRRKQMMVSNIYVETQKLFLVGHWHIDQ